MKFRIMRYAELDSTNAEAKRLPEQAEGTVIVAEHQTAGRGRLGRTWESAPSEGIYMTIILNPNVGSKVTLAAGLAVSRALKKYVTPRIKWPNDVYVNEKKICGILTEMISDSDIPKTVICGIGVNINNEYFTTPTATSLFLETGVKHDTSVILAELLESFGSVYEDFMSDSSSFMSEYESISMFQKILLDDDIYTAVGVHESGGLIVRNASGVERIMM